MKGIRIGVLFVLITTNACSLAQILTSSVDSEELHTLINDVNQQSGIEAVHYVRGRVQKVIRSPLDMVLVGRLFEEASKSYDRCFISTRELGCSPYLSYGFAYWLSMSEQYEQSNEILTPLLETGENLPYARLSLGYNYMNLDKTMEAIAVLEEAAKIFPDADPDLTYRIHNNLGIVYSDLEKLEKSIVHYQKATEANPHDPFPFQNIGAVYQDLGEWEKAIEYGRQAIEISSYPAAHYALGSAYLGVEAYGQAAEQFEIAVELLPTYKIAWLYLGNSYVDLGRYSEARNAYKECLKIDPEYVHGWAGLGWVSNKLGDYESAIEEFQHALQYGPDDRFAQAQLQRALSAKNNPSRGAQASQPR